jgi:hypothetical protein
MSSHYYSVTKRDRQERPASLRLSHPSLLFFPASTCALARDRLARYAGSTEEYTRSQRLNLTVEQGWGDEPVSRGGRNMSHSGRRCDKGRGLKDNKCINWTPKEIGEMERNSRCSGSGSSKAFEGTGEKIPKNLTNDDPRTSPPRPNHHQRGCERTTQTACWSMSDVTKAWSVKSRDGWWKETIGKEKVCGVELGV